MKRESDTALRDSEGEAAVTRREITDAAKALFATQGFAATTVRQIARKVSLKAGSLYYHFGGKEEILFAILDEGNRLLLEAADQVIRSKAKGAPSTLRHLVLEHMRILAADPAQFMVVSRELNRLKGERKHKVMAQREQYERMVQGLLSRGIREGTFRECNVKVVSFGLIAMLNGVAYWFRPQGKLSMDQIAEQYSKTLLDGLRVQPKGCE